jgi:choloylglycine hydrolase
MTNSLIRSAAALVLPTALVACSGITMVKDGTVLLAANNDYSYSSNMLLRVTPAVDGQFGRICLSMETVPGWTPVGMKCMNDQGLAYMHAVVPKSVTPYDPDKPQFRHNFLEKIVAEAATVKQAISLVRAYSLPPQHSAHVHLLLADASGDSAVIEWVDGDVKVLRRSGMTQIITNSLLSKPDPPEPPKSRFWRGSRMLESLSEPSVNAAVSVLKEISIRGRYKGDEVGSIDSAVFDITGRKVHVFYKRDFDHGLVLDLDSELAKGPRTEPLSKIFPNPIPFETGFRAETGPYTPKGEK